MVKTSILTAAFISGILVFSSVPPVSASSVTYVYRFTVPINMTGSSQTNSVKITPRVPYQAPAEPSQAAINLNASPSIQEQQMLNLVNKERTSRGIKPLTVDMRLVKVARMKSQDMIKNNYFAHQSATYGSPFDLMHAQGITYRHAGENLAGTGTVTNAHNLLMNSSGHRANILDAGYAKIGIGIIKGGPYGLMISQEFIG